MKITLPWPDKRLSPNFRSRVHWPRTNAIKTARATAWGLAKEAGWPKLPKSDGRIRVGFTFYPPDNRGRDDDNLIASLKAYRDGLADALGCDDRRFDPEYHFADPEKPGRVVVEIAG